MDLASELAPFSPSAELLFWAENRVGGLLEQVKTNATEIHWRDAKIEKLTLELAYLRRMKFGVKSESLAAGTRDLFDETLAADLAACEARLAEKRQAAEMGPHQPSPRESPNANAPAVSPCPSSCPGSSTCTSPKPAPVGNVVRRWCGSART
jgi:transposase